MNVLMATTFFPPHVGGAEYHVLNLSKHLARRGHRITVLTSALKKALSDSRYDLGKNIEIVEVKTYFLPARPYQSLSSVGITIRSQEKVRELIEEKDIEIVHAHGHHYPLSWNTIKAAEAVHVPSVLTLHGLYALGPTGRFGRTIEELFNVVLFSRMLGKSTSVIGLTRTITEYAKKYAREIDNRFYTIPNGVDVDKFLKAKPLKRFFRRKYDLPENATVFLYCGRFAEAKGVLEFAKAASLFAKRCKQAFFLFVGGGPLSAQLNKWLETNRGMDSKIVGWVPNSEIHELYIASDFYVLPSKWEALPITIIEALASGLHIVATPVGGIPDVLLHYPRKTYIRGFSSTKIADALEDAYSNFDVTNAHATPESLENFDWSYITTEIEKVYYEALEHGPND